MREIPRSRLSTVFPLPTLERARGPGWEQAEPPELLLHPTHRPN